MHDITDLNPDDLPDKARLIKATIVAFSIAALLLVLVVMPAEYGIDLTGFGEKTGLLSLADTGQEALDKQTPAINSSFSDHASTEVISKASSDYRSQEMSLSLLPNQGAEIKAIMNAKDTIVYQWWAKGGAVYFDMHGEEMEAAPDEYTSYWIAENQASAAGSMMAPFYGKHGWYWENRGETPVEIKLTISGFYQNLIVP